MSAHDVHVYIVHYTKLVERRRLLEKQLRAEYLDAHATWLVDFDRETITPEDRTKFGKISDPAIGNYKSVLTIYQSVIDLGLDYALILEDDVILCHNFKNIFQLYMKQLLEIDPEFDMLFIEPGCEFHLPPEQYESGRFVYLKSNEKEVGGGATRCTAGYVVSNSFCRKFMKTAKFPTSVHIDLYLNDYARREDLRVYWAEPTIVKQNEKLQRSY